MPRSASAVGLAKRGVIPRKQFYTKLFFLNTVILVTSYLRARPCVSDTSVPTEVRAAAQFVASRRMHEPLACVGSRHRYSGVAIRIIWRAVSDNSTAAGTAEIEQVAAKAGCAVVICFVQPRTMIGSSSLGLTTRDKRIEPVISGHKDAAVCRNRSLITTDKRHLIRALTRVQPRSGFSVECS